MTGTALQTKSVLLIDDDPYVRESIMAVLSANGFEIEQAASAAEGREAIAARGPDFDAILLDLWLPEENGLAILKHLREVLPDAKVVVMSGGGPGRTLEQAVAMADALGADAVLIKPFQNAEILEALARL